MAQQSSDSAKKFSISYPILHHVYFNQSGIVKTTHKYDFEGGDLGLYLEERILKRYKGQPVIADYVSNRNESKHVYLVFYWNNDKTSQEYRQLVALYAEYGQNQKVFYKPITKNWYKKTGSHSPWSKPSKQNSNQLMSLIRWNKYSFDTKTEYKWPMFDELKKFDDVVIPFESASQLNALCDKLELTTEQLAKILGFTRLFTYNYRNGKTEMSDYAYTLLLLFTNQHEKLELASRDTDRTRHNSFWYGMVEPYDSKDMIVEIRNELGVTQLELALMLGLSSQQVVNMYENGSIAMRPILYTFLLLIGNKHPKAYLRLK